MQQQPGVDSLFGSYMSDVAGAVSAGLAAAGAGASGMVAEQRSGSRQVHGIPSGYYGALSDAISRSHTPLGVNPMPASRHRFRDNRRSTSPRRKSSGTPPNPLRAHASLPQMQQDDEIYDDEIEQRFLKLENMQRSTAQFVALDHRAISAITEQINKIMTQYETNIDGLMKKTDGINNGLVQHVLSPIQRLHEASVEQNERIKCTQNVVIEHQRQLAELMTIARDIQQRVNQPPAQPRDNVQANPWTADTMKTVPSPTAARDFVAWPVETRQRETVTLDNGSSFRRWVRKAENDANDVQAWMVQPTMTTTQAAQQEPTGQNNAAAAAAPADQQAGQTQAPAQIPLHPPVTASAPTQQYPPTPTSWQGAAPGSVPFDPWAPDISAAQAARAGTGQSVDAEQASLDSHGMHPAAVGAVSYNIATPQAGGQQWTGGPAPPPAAPPGFGAGGGGGGGFPGNSGGGGGGGFPGNPGGGGAEEVNHMELRQQAIQT